MRPVIRQSHRGPIGLGFEPVRKTAMLERGRTPLEVFGFSIRPCYIPFNDIAVSQNRVVARIKGK